MTRGSIIILSVLAVCANCAGELIYKGVNYACWEKDGFLGDKNTVAKLDSLGANWIAVVITPYQDDYRSDSIYVDPVKTPSDSSVMVVVSDAKAHGLSVMLRIQVDSKDGVWRGYFDPANSGDWFSSYGEVIQRYAVLSESLNVDMFGIGCEYKSLSNSAHLDCWKDLINTARGEFTKPIIYCANWDEYQSVAFWKEVDLAGIDAYFPLSDAQHPEANELQHGWYYYTGVIGRHDWVDELKQWQQSIGKPVIFTEIGFRNVDYVAKEPWKVWEYTVRDDINQANAYEASFRVVASEMWCQGLFWWCYYPGPQGENDIGWEPENKPAEEILATWFKGYNRTIPAGDLSGIAVYPNPASYGINISKVPGTLRASIYNVTGQRIKVLDKNNDSDKMNWNLRDDSGQKCPSGLYLVVLDCYGEVKKTKLMIIK
jgi:hypothetical protein